MSGITAILTGYNRPLSIHAVHAAVETQTIKPDDIWVWYNRGTEPQVECDNSKIVMCNHNFGFYSRFALALLAKTEYVALFDDDTVPGPRWFENCMETMQTHEGILGTVGIRLTGKSYQNHFRFGWPRPLTEPVDVDLAGHAWFFRRDWLKYMWMDKPLTFENGEDIHFAAQAQIHGGIKCYVPPHPSDDLDCWGSIHGDLLGSDNAASWRKNTSRHLSVRDAIVRDEITRGWKPLFMCGYNAQANEVPLAEPTTG